MISTLHEFASTTLASYQSESEEGDGSAQELNTSSAGNVDQQQHFYPPISELFVALMHSARSKASTFMDQR